jgi:hypothetical protein
LHAIAQQVARSPPDDLGLTFPSFIKLAGKDPNSARAFEKPSNVYAIYWVNRIQDLQRRSESEAAADQALSGLLPVSWTPRLGVS